MTIFFATTILTFTAGHVPLRASSTQSSIPSAHRIARYSGQYSPESISSTALEIATFKPNCIQSLRAPRKKPTVVAPAFAV